MVKASGFTLIEILITLAIFTVLLGLGLFMTLDAYRGSLSRSEVEVVVSLLERARSRAMANVGQSPWGVCYAAPNYAVFKGTTCAPQNPNSEITPADTGVAIAGFDGVVFAQLSGTTTGASITITQNGKTELISINHEGTITE